MIPCPACSWPEQCATELQRGGARSDDPAEFRGLTPLQLGVSRHLSVVHRLPVDDAANVARAWCE